MLCTTLFSLISLQFQIKIKIKVLELTPEEKKIPIIDFKIAFIRAIPIKLCAGVTREALLKGKAQYH